MRVGDRVRTGVALPNVPAGSVGRVKEIGRLFVAVAFEDGRLGYYCRPQLLPESGEASRPASAAEANLGFTTETVAYGSHLCLLPSNRRESVEVVARYLAAGLRGGDLCFCAASPPYTRALVRSMDERGIDHQRAIASGSLTLSTSRQLYLQGTRFNGAAQLVRSLNALGSLPQRSGQSIRCFGYPGKILREVDLAEWWEYETRVTPLLKAQGVLALCGYDHRGVRRSQWRQAEAVHPYVVKGGQLMPGGAPAGDRSPLLQGD
jgi:hypothetical protein